MRSATDLLFVYGTLRRGQPNHARVLARYRAPFVGVARTAAGWELRDLGGFPAMVRGTGDVAGDVFEIRDPDAWLALDMLEGAPRFYRRERVVLADGRVAQTYVFAQPTNAPRIEGGDWTAHVARRRGRQPAEERA